MIADLFAKLKALKINVQVVNDNLDIQAPKGVLTSELLDEIRQHKAGLIGFIKSYQQHRNNYNAIPLAPVQDSYPLSASQHILWVVSQFEEGNVAYNMSGVYTFEGQLDKPAFTRSFDTLLQRHESLRTVFKETEGGLRQFVLSPSATGFQVRYEDLQDDHDTTLDTLLFNSAHQPFDLQHGPLLRAELYQVGTHKWVFNYVMHHIVSDGWSMDVLIRELLQLYNAFISGAADPLPPLEIQYKDYAVWHQEQLSGTTLETHKAYWLDMFSGELPVLDLPADKVRPALKTFNGASLSTKINAQITAGMRALVRKEDVTLFMGLLAAVEALLYRYTGQEDMVIGTPVAGREHADLEDQIGFYVNTLALRNRFKGSDSFLELLDNVKKVTLAAYEHQIYPFSELVEALHLQRDMSRNPLFDIQVILGQHAADSDAQQTLGDLRISPYEGGKQQTSRFDMVFSFAEVADELHLDIQYNSDVYTEQLVTQLSIHLEQLLLSIVRTPENSLKELPMLTAADKQQQLVTFNGPIIAYDKSITVLDLFQQQVRLRPDETAVFFDGISQTYRELDEQSTRLAHYLLQNHEVAPDELVGILLDRSEKMITGILGILKAGGAYVPVDPEYPAARRSYILNDTNIRLLLTQTDYMFDLGDYNGAIFAMDVQLDTLEAVSSPLPVISPEQAVYVIYTSGSTGNPKGVVIRHNNLLHSLVPRYQTYGTPSSFLLLSSFSFDSSIAGIFGTLCYGGRLCLTRKTDVTNVPLLAEYIIHHGVSHLLTVPSYYQLLLQELAGSANELKGVIVAGETCPVTLVEQHYKILPDTLFYNEYGPTEGTVWSSVHLYEKSEPFKQTIGKPIANTEVYILGEDQQLLPLGVPGELCIAGDGVAAGYLNQPALTAEKFVQHPFRDGARMYRTGDLARWFRDGTLDFLGRKDDQVKIRGYRIELGEVEQALQQYEGIAFAVVLAYQGMLVAYLVGNEGLNVSSIQNYLNTVLPAYAIPADYIQLDELPLTPNGKVDKKRLPAPGAGSMDSGIAYVAPRNTTEEQLLELWKEVLGKDRISIKDNFFESGGHSLVAIRLVGLIHKAFDVKLELKELFTHPVLEQQAVLIAAATGVSFVHIPVAPAMAGYPLSSSQRRLWLLAQMEDGNVAYNMPGVYVFEGHLNKDILELSFLQLIARHEILRTVFRNQQQIILNREEAGFRLHYSDQRNTPAQAGKVKELVERSFVQPFDLAEGPLLRAGLYQLSDHKWVFSYVMHHIISDGVSMDILIRELLTYYNAGLEGSIAPLAPLRIQYKDYAVWQQEQLADEHGTADREYWRSQFSGELPLLDLTTDKPRPAIKTYNGAFVEKHISAAAAGKLGALAAEQGGTLFMGLLALVNALLYRYTGQEDIIIGSPVAGRQHADLEDQIGFYVNTLALRTRFKKEDNFRSLLAAIREITIHAYEHQLYPFDELAGMFNLQRDMSRNVLFDVGMILHRHDTASEAAQQAVKDLQVSAYHDGEYQLALFDLTFIFTEKADGITLSLQYNTDLYYESTATQLATHLVQLLNVLLDEEEQPLMLTDFLQVAEKQQLDNFGGHINPVSATDNILDLFEGQAVKNSDRIALVSRELQLTYRELNEKANQVAYYLRTTCGIAANDLVGIRLERNEWLIIAILGVLKAGAAYLPVDPDYPDDRVDYMLSDSAVKVLIDNVWLNTISNEPGHHPVQDPARATAGNDLAYVIYTSGSTGKPKGVPIRHSNLYNFFRNIIREYPGNQPVVQPFIASCAFDISVFQLFTPLLTGGTAVMVDRDQFRDISRFTDILKTVTYIDTVPAVYNLICGYIQEQGIAADFKQVERLFIGGDLIPDSLLLKLSDIFCNAVITVTYGPTEATIFCTQLSYTPGTIHSSTKGTVIGRPLSGTHISIVNEQGQLCPVGVTGEICISGNGLSGIYLNNEKLTAEKYKVSPSGQLLYKTGDLGRWLPDGTIGFMGRNDTQVKIRGFRIELGEIEKQLEDHPDLSRAVVIAKKDDSGQSQLIAYIEKKKRVLLTPSTSEFFVYDDLLYFALTTNQKRNGHYIRSFNRHLKGKVVLDLGTGADAILSRFCIDAGAKKVYAVEILKETYDKAQKRIRDLGLEDRITLIHGNIMEIELPEKVDYCVSEIVGSIGGSEGAAKLINATRRFLKDPANMLPVRSLTKIAAAHLPDDMHDFTFDEIGRHYMNRIFDEVGYRFDVRMSVEHFPVENVISNHQPFEDLDFTKEVKLEDTHPVRFEFTRDAVVNGFIVWLNLYVDEQEVMDTLSEKYNWLPVYLPVFYNETRVSKGDYIEGFIERKLAENGLNPDFIITGTLFRKGEAPLPFSFTSANQGKEYRSNPFYDKLFENDELRLTEDITENTMRAYLENTLPGYMIPSRFVQVEQLPLTSNGKVDRRNLPDPVKLAGEENDNYLAPQTPIEQLLTEIYEDVLKKPRIGIRDNYFSLGGDSIKSIQIVSRLKQRGFELSIQDVLLYPQIAEVALYVNSQSRSISQETQTGIVPLGPVQLSFFDQTIPQRHHFNQSVLLNSDTEISAEGLQQAIDKLVLHHDALRMVFNNTGDGWVQENKGEEQKCRLEEITANNEATFLQESTRIQTSIDLAEGPLFKAALFNGAGGTRILLVIHHLVIDTVSWRILLEDLATLYHQYHNGEPLHLPLKTDAFGYWQQKLREYAASAVLLEEQAYWAAIATADVPLLPTAYAGTNLLRDVAVSSFSLDETLTETLLTNCYRAYRTDVNDILTGAFSIAVSEVFGLDKVLIQLEGHGREHIGPDVDISRTVGWFTTVYPVLFDMRYQDDIVRQVIEVKESLHRIPNKGIGYGVLRYLSGMDYKITPQISFNYLGDMGAVGGTGVFHFSGDDKGADMAADTSRDMLLEVTGMVLEGKMHLSISYSDKQYGKETIEELTDAFREKLVQLIGIFSEENTEYLTPVDLTWQGLSFEQLNQLNKTL